MSAVTSTQYERVSVLTLKDDLVGEVVDVLANEARKCLAQGHISFVVDCSHVGGFDSAALEVLLDLQNQCEELLGAVKLCGLDPTCVAILEITRLSRRFETFEDLESAVRSFA
jgi:anti-anti-sigma factor